MKRRLGKQIISLVLVFCTLLSLLPISALAAQAEPTETESSVPFHDVKQDAWYYDSVMYAYVNGLVNGTSDTTFDPQGGMTRGMFVTVLGRMAGVDTENYLGQSVYSDVAADKYYAPYVAWASKHGITTGIGDGIFSPDALINRQQLATFFVRYCEAFDVEYGEDTVTTQPADIDEVAVWAKDAVLTLWSKGILNGDGTNFNPTDEATRAEAVTLSTRMDAAVEIWYSEPGVESDRVRIDPATSLPFETEEGPADEGSSDNTSDSNIPSWWPSYPSYTYYYEVTFALGNGQSVDITLPQTATYPANTSISELPTPSKAGAIFLGWYYDAAMTDGVETGDVVDRNMTLYAKVAAGEEVTALDTPNYVTRTEVAAGTYTFDVLGATNINTAFKFINITGGNMDVVYDVNGTTVSATLEAGQTYQVELIDDVAQFKLSGESKPQSESIRYLNILTAKTEVTKAELNSGVKQIPVGQTTGLGDNVFKGLYQIDENGTSTQNVSTGTFTYTGSEWQLQTGDTVAITSSDADLTDVTSTAGDVAYLKITNVSGTTYSYEMAEVEDVLFIPDVLPIQNGWDTDGDTTNNKITITAVNLATAMGNVEADHLDKGDFIGFLNTAYSADATAAASYGKITGYTTDGSGNYVISYTTATLTEIESALDVYYTQDRDISLTDDEKRQIETEVKEDLEDSGYVEEAALYLASVMLESDNLENVPDMEQVTYNMRTMQASSVRYGNSSVTRAGGGNTVKVSFNKNNIQVSVAANNQLEHLNGKGFDVTVRVPFTVTISGSGDNELRIKIVAEFEEEVILKQKISTKRHKIGFLKYDYSLNASFEVGNYTGIKFQADVYTADESNQSLAEKLEKIMDQMEAHQNNGTPADDGTMGSLAEIYQDVMKSANDTWIDLIDVKLFENNGNAFLHIFCWQVKGSFVVSANLSVSMGMSFDYTMQKKYNFSVRVKAKTATNQVIDIIEPQYNFDFYVVGTIGIRAGLRLEMYVGLISLKLDKIGITAEVGAYTRLWGYFFHHLEWRESAGKKINSAGAMLVEIGIYLEIKFVAQVFNSSKLTWNPTLFSKEWPLWSAGERQNVYAFAQTNDTNYTLKTTKTLALPGSTYQMKYMDLKNGETANVSKDDGSESSFIITFSNPAFTYDAATNTVTVSPANGSLAEQAEMVITWKKAPLSFTSTPIQKVIRISWSDPEGMRYISFNSMGGSAVEQISGGSGSAITWPANPIKTGYTFAGWYTDSDCTTAYSGSTTVMPAFVEGAKGVTLYAKWACATVSYTVEHYLEQLNGTYTLADTEQKTGFTESATAAIAYTVYTGFDGKDIVQQTIAADGSTVVKVYYDRNSYTATFAKNDGSGESIVQTYRYGETINAPIVAREGYAFKGWATTEADTGSGSYIASFGVMDDANQTYYAQWGNENTVIFDSQGGSDVDSAAVRTGEKITRPETDPTRTGYTFGGWYKDSICTDDWVFDTDTVSGDTTLYAKWTPDSYTISYDLAGGEVAETNPGTYNIESNSITLINPTKTGYTFTGWSGTELPEATTTVTIDTGSIGNREYVATWTANSYSVKFDKNNTANLTVSGSMADQNFTYDTAQNLTANAFTLPDNSGYTFMGWATEANGSVVYNDGASVSNLATVANGSVTLYAVWKQGASVSYTVEHYQHNVNDSDYTKVDTQSLNGIVGTLTGAAANSYTGFTAKSFEQATVAASGTVVKIYYDRNRYGVTVKEDTSAAGTTTQYYYGAQVTVPAALTKEGYTFNGWSNGTATLTAGETFTMGTAPVTLTAQWTVNQYTTSYNLDGGSVDGSNPTTYTVESNAITLINPTKPGYTFAGWTGTGLSAATETVTIAKGSTGNREYVATWTANTNTAYTVQHYQQQLDGTYNLVETDNKTGTTATEAEAVAKSYAGFVENTTHSDRVAKAVIQADNTTVLKLYYSRESYQVTIANGATGIGGAGTYVYGAEVTLTSGTKTGYTFNKWISSDVTVTDNKFTMPAKAVTVTADWTANTYTVAFNANGGTGTMADQSFTYDEAAKALTGNAFTRIGYTFSGWATTAGGTKAYENSESVQNLTAEANGTVSLYAVWTIDTYTISYNLDGGSVEGANPATYTVESDAITLINPTKSGHTFAGWTGGDLDAATTTVTIAAGSTGDRSYTATWTQAETGTTYNLWVGGSQFSAGNLTFTDGNGGTAEYNPSTNTLTLTNYTYEGVGSNNSSRYGSIFYCGTETLKIVLVGSNTISNTSTANTQSTWNCGLYSTAAVTISGEGSLTIAGGKGYTSHGISVNGDLTISGGTVKVLTQEADGVSAIYAANSVTINGGTVTAIAAAVSGNVTNAKSYGIELGSGSLTINGGTVTAQGYTSALEVAPSLNNNVTASASATYEGSTGVETYVFANNSNYMWFKAE